MRTRQLRHQAAFTLVELMVVIAIIILLVAMSLPAMAGHMRIRKLKSSARIIQGAVMETRSRAIARRQDQYVVFFVNGTSYTSLPAAAGTVNGKQMSVASFDNTGQQEGQPLEFPEHIQFIASGVIASFHCTFQADGTVALSMGDKDSEAGTPAWDIILQQQTLPMKCYIDIVPMTGQVIFEIKD